MLASMQGFLVNAGSAKIKERYQSVTKLWNHVSLVSTCIIATFKPSNRSPIARIQYYQKPIKSIGMAMTIRLFI